MEAEALDHTVWRTLSGRGYGRLKRDGTCAETRFGLSRETDESI